MDSLQKIHKQQSITKEIYFATCSRASFLLYPIQSSQMRHPPEEAEEIENNPPATKNVENVIEIIVTMSLPPLQSMQDANMRQMCCGTRKVGDCHKQKM